MVAVHKMGELEALLGVADGAAKLSFSKKYKDFFFSKLTPAIEMVD